MLRRISDIKGYTIGATDGPIGAVTDFLFDDATWRVRWLVVDTGHIIPGQKVLLPPSVLGHVNHIDRQFSVRLTQAEVKASPGIDTDAPVSRRMEAHIYDYYGWSPYWATGFYMGGFGYAGGLTPAPMIMDSPRETGADKGDPHLRSIDEVRGYHLHATDGEIGHLADCLVEDMDWTLRYLIADTQNWWPGQKVLIAPRQIKSIEWSERLVNLDMSRNGVKGSPPYDETKVVDRPYEAELRGYYDKPRLAEVV
jgi:hypothetical protein